MIIRAWLELTRLSNAPTIVSNVLVGWAIGRRGSEGDATWAGAAMTAVAMLLLYVGGMALNDVMDEEVDQAERPNRPIPSGRITRTSASLFIVVCFSAALVLLALQNRLALAYGFVLMIAIILYNILHARSAAAVILMGACRGLVYVTAALAAGGLPQWSVLGLMSGALVVYVILFSLVARGEAGAARMRFEPLLVLTPMVAVVFGEFVPTAAPAGLTILGRAALLLWTVSIAVYVQSPQRHVGRAVAGWIAGIALLDLYHLTRLDEPESAMVAGVCFVLTLLGQKWVAGT